MSFFTRVRTMQVALLILAGFAPVARANILFNGGFELPDIGLHNFQTITGGSEPINFSWQVVTNSVDLVSQGLLGSGTFFEGTQGIDLVGSGTTGAIAQTFATTPGQLYALTFAYSNNFVSTPTASAAVTVVNGITLLSATVTHNTANGTTFDWTTFSQDFVANGTSATITFNNTFGMSDGGLMLDAVDISLTTPEPASIWLVAGVLGIALLLKRRVAYRTSKA